MRCDINTIHSVLSPFTELIELCPLLALFIELIKPKCKISDKQVLNYTALI